MMKTDIKEVGRFYGFTWDGQVYTFIVYDNKKISLPMYNLNNIYKINLKPKFELFCDEGLYLSPAEDGVIDGLIKYYDIEPKLFNYLKKNKMIKYSTEMAYLYNFPDKKGCDYVTYHKRPVKHSKKIKTMFNNFKVKKCSEI